MLEEDMAKPPELSPFLLLSFNFAVRVEAKVKKHFWNSTSLFSGYTKIEIVAGL